VVEHKLSTLKALGSISTTEEQKKKIQSDLSFIMAGHPKKEECQRFLNTVLRSSDHMAK
jgi:hypothetical protein